MSDEGFCISAIEPAAGEGPQGAEHVDVIVVTKVCPACAQPRVPAGHAARQHRISEFVGARQLLDGVASMRWCMRSRIASQAKDLQGHSRHKLFVEMLKKRLHHRWLSSIICTVGKDGANASRASECHVGSESATPQAIAGIGLTFLRNDSVPEYGDFGGRPLSPNRRDSLPTPTRFFPGARRGRISAERRAHGRSLGAPPRRRTGAAFHSLRAVPLEILREATLRMREIDPGMPVHIHVAEQLLEVQACKRCKHWPARPIELLLQTSCLLTQHWCLVHATHATADEIKGIAAANAVVCVSISTGRRISAMGSSIPPAFSRRAGGSCVGSDSQSTVNPAEEADALAGVSAAPAKETPRRFSQPPPSRMSETSACGVTRRSTRGGQAIGQPAGVIASGPACPDWLVLGGRAFVHGRREATESALDHLLFAGGDAAICAMSWSQAVG